MHVYVVTLDSNENERKLCELILDPQELAKSDLGASDQRSAQERMTYLADMILRGSSDEGVLEAPGNS